MSVIFETVIQALTLSPDTQMAGEFISHSIDCMCSMMAVLLVNVSARV